MREETREKLEVIIEENKPLFCERCKGKLIHIGAGKYKCKSCGRETLDEGAKLNRALKEDSHSIALTLSQMIGVNMEMIELLLEEWKIEQVPEGLPLIKCAKCGRSVRHGRYCELCKRELARELRSVMTKTM